MLNPLFWRRLHALTAPTLEDLREALLVGLGAFLPRGGAGDGGREIALLERGVAEALLPDLELVDALVHVRDLSSAMLGGRHRVRRGARVRRVPL